MLFISDDFFKDLQAHKTPNGIEFRKKKDKTIYTNFPDQLPSGFGSVSEQVYSRDDSA